MSGVEDNRKFRCKTCGAIYHYETAFETAQACRTCGDVNYEQIRITLVCDFCSGQEVAWTYPCDDFVMTALIPGLPDENKVGAWAACDECHTLIETDAWEAVAERAVEQHESAIELNAKARKILRLLLLRLHEQFQAHRAGTAYPYKEGTEDAA